MLILSGSTPLYVLLLRGSGRRGTGRAAAARREARPRRRSRRCSSPHGDRPAGAQRVVNRLFERIIETRLRTHPSPQWCQNRCWDRDGFFLGALWPSRYRVTGFAASSTGRPGPPNPSISSTPTPLPSVTRCPVLQRFGSRRLRSTQSRSPGPRCSTPRQRSMFLTA